MTDDVTAAIDLVLSEVDLRHVGCGGVVELVPPIDGQAAFVRCQRCTRSLVRDDPMTAAEVGGVRRVLRYRVWCGCGWTVECRAEDVRESLLSVRQRTEALWSAHIERDETPPCRPWMPMSKAEAES